MFWRVRMQGETMMELLQEIKEEVLELSKANSLEENIKVLDIYTQKCKDDLSQKAQQMGLKLRKSVRLLKNIHLHRSLAYQEVFVDEEDNIVKYGDIYIKGRVSHFSGAGLSQSNSFFSRVALPSNIEFVEIFGGFSTFYALPKEGNFIYVWGKNANGCAGVGHTNPINIPRRVEMKSRVIKILSGQSLNENYQSALALCEDKRVYVAGRNATGQLGTNNTLDISTWTQNPYLTNIKDIYFSSMGSEAISMCIDEEGSLYVFGHNIQGACGAGTFNNVLRPNKLTFDRKVIKARASFGVSQNTAYSTSLILLEGGTCLGAGYNGQLQLSQGNTNNSPKFVPLALLNVENKGIIDIFPASIWGTAFLLKDDGRLLAFGQGEQGWGDSSTLKSQNAHVVAKNIQSFQYCDKTHTRAIAKTRTGGLIAFGYNNDGALGIGTKTVQKSFAHVYLPANFKDYKLYPFNAEAHLMAICGDDIYACGTSLDNSLLYTTPTLQKQT